MPFARPGLRVSVAVDRPASLGRSMEGDLVVGGTIVSVNTCEGTLTVRLDVSFDGNRVIVTRSDRLTVID
jgi:hypothetical protein